MSHRIIATVLLSFSLLTLAAQNPQVTGITSYPDVVEDPIVGSGTFSITATYDQPMNTGVNPVISFPTAGENPVSIGMLVPGSGSWTDATTFVQYYDVVDLNQILSRVDVQVSGGLDASGNVPGSRVETDLFCASTSLPVPRITSVRTDHRNSRVLVEFDRSTNYGGLTFLWSDVDSLLYLQIPALGDRSVYFDFQYEWITRTVLRVPITRNQDTDFRDLHAYIKWPIAHKDDANACRLDHYWNGNDFDIDYIVPYVTSLTTNLSTITEGNIGTGTFQIVAQYNENVGGTTVFSFPTLNEDPSNVLTLISTVKSDNNSKVTATYSVANVSTFIPDIDVKVSGATNDPYYNSAHEPQADTIFTNVFSVNTCAHSVAPGIGKIPDLGVVCIGDTLTVFTAPGRDGTGYCEDQYRYSTDDGANWSAWSTTVPVFAGVYGKNKVQSRRYCDGNCSSEINELTWQASDDDDPVIVCPTNQVLSAAANCSNVLGNWDATSATDNCGTVIVTQSPDSSTVVSGIGSTQMITLTADDTHGRTATCSFTVTLQDQTAPTVICKDATVYLNASNNASVAVNDVYQSGHDDCGTVNLVSVSPTTFNCSNVGTNAVTLTVNDGHGNINTCTATVTVQDTVPPSISCKNPIFSLNAGETVTIASVDVYNGGTDNCGSVSPVSVVPNAFTDNNLGNNTVVFTASAANGNTSSCTSIVSIFSAGSSSAQPLGITASDDLVEDDLVGSSTFSITVVYNEAMNIAVNPVISFPTSGENAVGVGMLVPATAVWEDAYTFTQYYDVVDLNQVLPRVDVQVSGGADLNWHQANSRLETDLFCASTGLAVPKIINIKTDHRFHVIYIEFDVSTNFGGLSSWNHADSLLYLQFPQLGDLSAYFDFQYQWITRYYLKVTPIPTQQTADFRDIHTYFRWPIARRENNNACRLDHYWNGDNFDLDFTAPYITSLTTNLSTITDANTGAGTFTITAQYNENAGGNPVFSFPTLGEDPSSVLTLVSTVKTNNNSTLTATYNVANVAAFIPNIDVKVVGAINEPEYNPLYEPQIDTIFTDVFSINTCTASTAPAIVRSPDLAVVCPGENLTIVATPGSGGSGTCVDEYNYSTDNGITWSVWSTTIPAFAGVVGTNAVQSRRACDGSCLSDTSIVYWNVEDVTAPTVVCKDTIIYLNGNSTASLIPADVFASGSDNCGTVNLVSVSPNTFNCSNLGSTTVVLTVDDNYSNQNTCIATVTVQDTVPPSISCKNPTFQLNAGETVTITSVEVYNGGTDNCGAISPVSVLPNTFTTADLGNNTVLLTVSDVNGNTSSCTSIVTILNAGSSSVQPLGITASHDVVEDPIVGSGTFSITVTYDQAMNTAVNPTISFPTPGENATGVGMLVPATAVWEDDHTFTQYYDVVDLNQILPRVDVQVSGGSDAAWLTGPTRLETDLFCASTGLAVPKIVSIRTYHDFHVIYITFDQSTNFGGFSGSWTQADSLLYLQFPQLGDISNYANLQYQWLTRYILRVRPVAGQQTPDFRDIETYFRWPITHKDNANACRLDHYWNGDDFDLDFTPPYVTSLTTNLSTITDADTGMGTFQIIAQYNENVGGDVQFSFPTLNENPLNTITLISTVKSDNDSKVTATYSVANASEFIPDIDIQVIGATNEPQYNSLHELQADTIFTDVFSINTCADSESPELLKSPDLEVICPGESLSVTVVTPGSGGSGSCADEYSYSTDGAISWSAWSTTLPAFTAVTGTSIVRSRRSCDGTCYSEISLVEWTVEDITAPTVVCQNITIDLDANGSASISTNDVFQSGEDNCGTINQISVSPNAFDCTNIGDNTVTLTIDDGHGNSADCTATVTVNDNAAPTVVCQNITIDLDANGSASISTNDVFQSGEDNCSSINQISVSPNTFDCNNLGDNTVTLTIDDGHGNSADCTATVTVNDNAAPTVVCQNISIDLDANGSASISTNDVFQSVTDNCGTINQVSVSPNSFDCTNLGDNTVTLTINDSHGNSADCTATVTVNDNSAPTVICQNTTINLDANGSASISTNDVFQSATDNCGTINQVSVSPNAFDCNNLGDNTVTLTIDDNHGNSADCTATVTVNDITAPTDDCQNITIDLDANGSASISTNDVFQSGEDNCGSINQVSVSPNSFDCTNIGDNTVTLTIDDNHGNSADCTATVTVNDNTNPCAPLPVELLDFKAFAEKDAIQLHWETASEHNNAGFQVERSENGWAFKEIAFVPGAGTTAEPQNYQLKDSEVHAGQAYFYRLKQINTNGSFEYSDIVQAMLTGGKLAIDIFPNPVSPNSIVQINLRLPQASEVVLTLFDTRGIVLRTEHHHLVTGAQALQMGINDLAAGTYFIKAAANGESVYQKLIVSW